MSNPTSPTSLHSTFPTISVAGPSPTKTDSPRMSRAQLSRLICDPLPELTAGSPRRSGHGEAGPSETKEPLSASSINTDVYPAISPYAASPTSPQPRSQILFYDKNEPYFEFTNFSPHTVEYEGRVYPTSEHLFQSFKFQGHRPGLAEHIRTCPTAREAFRQAQEFPNEVRPDWHSVSIQKMEETLWHKFTQHEHLKRMLLSTGDAELIEDSPVDAFWGVGEKGDGKNQLGKALMKVRDKLRRRE